MCIRDSNDTIGLMSLKNKKRKSKSNYQEKEEVPPLFDEKDVSKLMSQWKTFGYHQPIKIGEFSIVLRDAGHILGSAMVEFTYGSKKILFTGDLGNSPTCLLYTSD